MSTVSQRLHREHHHLLIDGQRLAGVTDYTNINPSDTREHVGTFAWASSRLPATPSLNARFHDALVERIEDLRAGHALSPRTQIGPVIEQAQLDQDDTPGHHLAPACSSTPTTACASRRQKSSGPRRQ